MKKIVILLCGFIVTTIGYAQVKTMDKQVQKLSKPVSVNTAVITYKHNVDSVELQKLYNDYKASEINSNAAFDKWIAKAKSIQEKKAKATSSELEMIDIQQLMSKRAQILQITTNMLDSVNQATKNILSNIR